MPNLLIVRNSYLDLGSVQRLLNYVLRTSFYGGYAIDPEQAYDQMRLVKEAYHKTEGVQLKHFLLTFSHEEMMHLDFKDLLELGFQVGKVLERYYDAEDCYAVGFPKEDHQRLHDALLECQGFVMVSYNYCPFIVDLYKEFYIFYTTRPNSMSQKAGSEYEEIVITNYDPRLYNSARHWQLSIFNLSAAEEDDGRYTLIHEPKTKSDKTEE